MTRFLLALRCFFAVLFGSRLPPQAVALLLSAERGQGRSDGATALAALPERPLAGDRGDRKPVVAPATPAPTPAPAPSVPAVVAALAAELPPLDASAQAEQRRRGAVQVLAVLQREGRLLDFLSEDIDTYSDGQIGAAVRDIHRGCRKALAEHVKVAPIRSEPDEAVVRIAAGHDASQVRLIGQVSGRPPFEGTLRHHGWRSTHINLPDIPAGHDPTVICPAEVEIGG
jgi:hypothetical protein